MNKKYFWAFFALMAIYLTLVLTLPTDPETLKKYDLSESSARLLNLTIVIPLSIIYFTALYGFLRFRSYARNVIDTKEGPPLFSLAVGLMVLTFGLPISSITGSLINYISFNYTDIVAEATIIRNYVSLIIPLVAFWYIARGAEGLRNTLKNKAATSHPTLALLGPIVIASLFSWLITTQPHSVMSEPTYYLPNWLIILTLAVPYVYVWCVGINAVRNLNIYKNRVKGLVYKRAIDYLAKGIAVIIVLSIFIQLIAVLSAQLNRLNLTPLLAVIYLLLVLYALGYGLVSRGAKRLKQIEEV